MANNKLNSQLESKLDEGYDLATNINFQNGSPNKNYTHNFQNNPGFIKYAQTVEKNLLTFEYVTEWADITAFLSKLAKVFSSFEAFNIIPEKDIVAKRLAQCLNPALPTGVHQKALSVYDQIFKKIGKAQLNHDLRIYATGIFPYIRNASIATKGMAIDILKNHVLPVVINNNEHLKSFLIAVLSGIERDKSDVSINCTNILKTIEKKVGTEIFIKSLFSVLVSSPRDREEILKFLISCLPDFTSPNELLQISGGNCSQFVKGLCLSLIDSDAMTVRYSLELLVSKFPIEKHLFSFDQFITIFKYSSQAVLRKDMSLNRRLFSLWLGPSDNRPQQRIYFIKNSLKYLSLAFYKWSDLIAEDSGEFYQQEELYRVLTALMDKPDITQPLLQISFLKLIDSLRIKKVNSISLNSNSEIRAEQVIRKFLYTVNPYFIWSQLTLLLFRNLPAENDAQLSNFSDKLVALENDIFLFSSFIDIYLIDNSEAASSYIPLTFFTLLSISHYISNLSNCESTNIVVETLLKTSTLLYTHLSLQSIADSATDLVNSIDESLTPFEYIKNIYHINKLLEIQSLNVSDGDLNMQLTEDFIDLTWNFEPDNNSFRGKLLILKSISILKMLIQSSNLSTSSLEDSCQLLIYLSDFSKSYITLNSLSPNIISNDSIVHIKDNHSNPESKYLDDLLRISCFTSNYDRFKISTETLLFLLKLGGIVNKNILFHNILTLENKNFCVSKNSQNSCSILAALITNLWRFMIRDNRLFISDLIGQFRDIYGENAITKIVLHDIQYHESSNSKFISKFVNLWLSLYSENEETFWLPNNSEATKKSELFFSSANNTHSNFPYFSLLITYLDAYAFDTKFQSGLVQKINPMSSESHFSSYEKIDLSRLLLNNSSAQCLDLEIVLVPIMHAIYLYSYQGIKYTKLPEPDTGHLGFFCSDYFHSASLFIGVENIIFYLNMAKKALLYSNNSSNLFLLSNPEHIYWFSGAHNPQELIENPDSNNQPSSTLETSLSNIFSSQSFLIYKNPMLDYLALNYSQSTLNINSPNYLELFLYLILPLIQLRDPPNSSGNLSNINPGDENTSNIFFQNFGKVNYNVEIQSSSLDLLDTILFSGNSCTRIYISRLSFSCLIKGLLNILSNDLPESNGVSAYDTLLNQSRCLIMLTKIIERVSHPCKCSTCLNSETYLVELKTLEILFIEFMESQQFSRVLILFLIKLYLSPEDSGDTLYHSFNSWADFLSLSIKFLCKHFSDSVSSLSDSQNILRNIISSTVLPVLNILTESLFIFNTFCLNSTNNTHIKINFKSSEIITKSILTFLNLYSDLLGICISFPSQVPSSLTLYNEDILKLVKKIIESFFAGSLTIEDSNNTESMIDVNDILDRIGQTYTLSLSYCLSSLVAFYNSLSWFGESEKKSRTSSGLYLSNNFGEVKSSHIPNFDHNILTMEIKLIFKQLWDLNSSEFALAICDFFENCTGCWIEQVFSPANTLNLSLRSEIQKGTGNGATSSSMGGQRRNTVNSYTNSDTGSTFKSSSFGLNNNNTANKCSSLSSSEFNAYESLLNSQINQLGVLHSLEFVNSLEFLSLNINDKKLISNRNGNLILSSLVMFLTSLIEQITLRINNNKSNEKNITSTNLNSPSSPNFGYGWFSSLSDIGLLRIIELLVETRFLELLNFGSKSVFNSEYSGLEPINHSDFHSVSKNFIMETDFSNLYSSSINFLKSIESSDTIEKPWIPFGISTSVSIAKLLGIISKIKKPDFNSNNGDNNSGTRSSFDYTSEQVEVYFNKIIEKSIMSIGKSISGSQWLRRVGKISQFNSFRSNDSPTSRKGYKYDVEASNRDSINPIKSPANNETLKKIQSSFRHLESSCKTGLNPLDSTILYALRSHGYVEPFYYWCNDDIIELTMQTLSLNVFPNIKLLFSSTLFLSQFINTFVGYILTPLNKILAIDKHVAYSSADIFHYLGIDTNPAHFDDLVVPTPTSMSSMLDLPLTSPLTTSLEHSFIFNKKKSNKSLKSRHSFYKESNIYENHISSVQNIDWCCVDQPSRIYVLILDALASLCASSKYEKAISRAAWDLFTDSNFFSIKKTAISTFPISLSPYYSDFLSLKDKSKYQLYKYLPHKCTMANLSSSFSRWDIFLQYCLTNDRDGFNELLSKLASFPKTTLFTNKSQEALQKSLLLRRISMLVWSGKPDQYISIFPTIQERLVELIKTHTYKNIINEIFLCLRVILLRMGPSRLVSMLPVIITELSKIINGFLKLDLNSLAKADFGSINMLYSCCKFLDLLFILRYPDFIIHNSTFINENIDSYSITNFGLVSNSNQDGAIDDFGNSPDNGIQSVAQSSFLDLKSPIISKHYGRSENFSTGLLDRLGNHLKSLSVLSNLSGNFSSEISASNRPLNHLKQNSPKKKSRNLNIIVPNGPLDSKIRHESITQPNEQISSISENINNKNTLLLNNKSSLEGCNSNAENLDNPFKSRLRRPLLVDSYINSPYDLIPFLTNMSNINNISNIETNTPDISYIETLVSQDLMVFFDLTLANTQPLNLKLNTFNKNSDSDPTAIFSMLKNVTGNNIIF
ncbi:Protein dopey-1 [Smittium culicis]|uniref:Protein dopey-1 n=1 Tax=Smittium culicis TaxID=133412 RepID=A0A1R1XM65_9FUNG|nr:Protein dopey-1 [Smittium culicis]